MNIIKLIENMDYRNFFLRLLFSLIFIFLYTYISIINIKLIFYLIILIYIAIIIEVYLYFKIYNFIPFIYIIVSFVFFLFIDINDQTILKFNLFICIVVSFDIFSYLIGKTLGTKKIISISPNKTIEGFIGGFTVSLFLGILLSNYLDLLLDINIIFFILLIIISSFVGDILESYFKRKNNLKNSSEIIPGHGGMFDRFDSFLFAIIIYSVFINLKL